jgi:flagellar hook protein FlgE
MYAAISGLNVHQTMLDVTANNLANVDTIGYKAQRTTFMDQLSQTIRSAAGPTTIGASGGSGGSNAMQVGLGVSLGSIDNIMNEGSMQTTGNTLDVAIQGDGFFQVGMGDPTTTPATMPTSMQYTRAGNFTLNSQGYLMTQNGEYVMGQANPGTATQAALQYIQLPPGSTNVAISQTGQVTYTKPDGTSGTPVYLSLATFPNAAGLTRDGGNMWSASLSSGTPPAIGSPGANNLGTTISGELEQSNVDLATEFTNMITAQRGFQANSRVISTADEMLQDLVNMKH